MGGHFANIIDAFDPETIAVLEYAFERAWNFIEQSDSSQLDRENAKEHLAMLIVAIARSGEKNALRIANSAIEKFRKGAQENTLQSGTPEPRRPQTR